MIIEYSMKGWRCSGCGKETEMVKLHPAATPPLPKGWDTILVSGRARTEYCGWHTFCPDCLKEREHGE